MKAKGEQMERAIQSAGGAEPAPHAVPPKYATAEQMERLIEAIGGGGGSGGAVPQPSDETPQMIADYGNAGVSAQYARADHVHEFDTNVIADYFRPLVLTLVPTDPSAPFSGTVTGASETAIRDAWYGGRVITAIFGDEQIRFSAAADNGTRLVLFGFIIYNNQSLGNPFVQFRIDAYVRTYDSSLFSGLTPIN